LETHEGAQEGTSLRGAHAEPRDLRAWEKDGIASRRLLEWLWGGDDVDYIFDLMKEMLLACDSLWHEKDRDKEGDGKKNLKRWTNWSRVCSSQSRLGLLLPLNVNLDVGPWLTSSSSFFLEVCFNVSYRVWHLRCQCNSRMFLQEQRR